jgi:hypothetical protein
MYGLSRRRIKSLESTLRSNNLIWMEAPESAVQQLASVDEYEVRELAFPAYSSIKSEMLVALPLSVA